MPGYSIVIELASPLLGNGPHDFDGLMNNLVCKIYDQLGTNRQTDYDTNPEIIAQLEISRNNQWHVHVAIDMTNTMQNKIAVRTGINDFFQSLPDDFEPQTNHVIKIKRNGNAWRPIDFESFCTNYLLRKIVTPFNPDLLNIECTIGRSQHLSLCQQIAFQNALSDPVDEDEAAMALPSGSGSRKRTFAETDMSGTSKGQMYQTTVEMMMSHRCFTIKDVHEKMPNYYNDQMAKNRKNYILSTLSDAKGRMLDSFSAFDLANKEKYPNNDVPDLLVNNTIIDIIRFQGYCPLNWCGMMVKWLSLDLGKRNCMTIWGTASSGKSIISKGIRLSVGNFGEVNKNNENFPFNDCHEKHLIVWEEGAMKKTYVEQAKQLMEGSSCRVDRKGTESCTIMPTPVCATTNVPLFVVHDGNTISNDETDALRYRMWGMEFMKPIKFNSPEFPYPYPSLDKLLDDFQRCLAVGDTYKRNAVPEFYVNRLEKKSHLANMMNLRDMISPDSV